MIASNRLTLTYCIILISHYAVPFLELEEHLDLLFIMYAQQYNLLYTNSQGRLCK